MWPNSQIPSNLVTFTEEILNRKLHFCALSSRTVSEQSFQKIQRIFRTHLLIFIIILSFYHFIIIIILCWFIVIFCKTLEWWYDLYNFLNDLNLLNWKLCHCMKSVQIRSFFWSVISCIQFGYRKMRTRKNSVLG